MSFGRSRRVDLPVAGRGQRAGPDQDGRNGPGTNTRPNQSSSKGEVSPDGEWVIINAPRTTRDARVATRAIPIRGGVPRNVCVTCSATVVSRTESSSTSGATGALPRPPREGRSPIPVPAGKSLPDLPAGGISVADGAVGLPGAVTIEKGLISPGPDPSTYVFTRTDSQRNLFRIPLH